MSLFATPGRIQRNKKWASQIAEFVPVLYILFIVFLMPLLDLGCTFVAGAIQYLATNDVAAKAATQGDYASALNTMTNEAYQFQGSGLAQFVHLSPAGGYTGCGDDLYVLSTDTGTGAGTASPANQPLVQPINTKTNMYELSVRSQYSVSPLINLSAVPVLGSIPGLGQPMVFVFNANRPVEHPGGLQSAPIGPTASGAVVPFPRVPSNPSTAPAPTAVTWRTPGIYQMIYAKGLTIVSDNVLIVPASSNWVGTGVSGNSGQTMWIDSSAVGLWAGEVGDTPWDANGYPGGTPASLARDLEYTPADVCSLIGCLGTPPVVPVDSGGVSLPNMFFVGNTLLNHPVNYTGQVYLRNNDNANTDDPGLQMVRIILTQ
jgi:Flp pilus assembly protein TadG